MNIRQLETFHWIAQLGTFSAAAERLSTSQANVSARIRELEEELGVVLFDRLGRQVQLTVKGRELLAHAQRVVSEAAGLRLAAGKPETVQGTVKIGLGEAIAAHSLVAIIDEVKHHYPDAEIEFDVDLNAPLVRKLVRGALDIAVLGGPVDAPELHLVPIGSMPLAWVGTASRISGRSTLMPADLIELPIMSAPREARLFTLMQEWFGEAGATPRRVSYCNNLSTMLDAARAGLCLCIVPTELAIMDVRKGILMAPPAIPGLPALRLYVATRLGSVDPAIPKISAIVAKAARLSDMASVDSPTSSGTASS